MSVVNPASNYPNLAQLNNASLAFTASTGIVQSLVQDFLVDFTATTYNPMVVALNEAIASIAVGANSSFRVLLCIDDGTVAYDSSKGANNTLEKFLAKTINENHNTRPEIMVAVLGNSGVGISDRFSSSILKFLKYQATRLGASTQTNLGTYRVSLRDAN